jgi:hypothetical protein
METRQEERLQKEMHSLLRIGSIAFIAGIVIFLVSTILHPGREDPTNHPLVFAEYAEDKLWVASHIGQFAGGMLAFAGGFIALFRLLSRSESGIASALAWMGLAATIAAGSALAVLQAVDGIALKIAVDSWYAIAPSSSADGSEEEKAIAFRVAEGIIDGLRLQPIAYSEFFKAQLE